MALRLRWFGLAVAVGLLIYAAGPAAGAKKTFRNGPWAGQTQQHKKVTFTASKSKLKVTNFRFSITEPCPGGRESEGKDGPFPRHDQEEGRRELDLQGEALRSAARDQLQRNPHHQGQGDRKDQRERAHRSRR